MRLCAWLCAMCAWSVAVVESGSVDTLVNTYYGPVTGKTFPVYNGAFAETINAYHGIPYALPPTGDRRFAAPVEVDPWVEELVADEMGDVCPQDLIGSMMNTHPDWDKESEDCLTVNVYAPYDTSLGPYPVMVWFHGGGFQSGGAPPYPGHFLASHHVVIVVAQYRLGQFGFLYTGDDAVTPNAGLYDQQMALQWVQKTIADFGGDPGKVTIFGQSAGAASVGLHLTSPHSAGLFHQAILESGTELSHWAVLNPNSPPEAYALQLAEEVSCPTENTATMVACLRTKQWRTIQRFNVNCTHGYLCFGMSPTIDGPGGFIPDWPRLLREQGQVNAVPVLSGICRNDGAIFNIAFTIRDPMDPNGLDRQNFTRDIHVMVELLRGGMTDSEAQILFNEYDFVYAPWPDVNDQQANLEAINEFQTDIDFGAAWDAQSKLHQQVAPVYNYIYDYNSDINTLPEWIGVAHSAENPILWGYPLMQLNENVLNDSQIQLSNPGSLNDIKMCVYLQTLFTNFAKFGNPTPELVPNPFDGGETEWPTYTWESMNYLHITDHPHLSEQWRQKAYALYDYLIPSTLGYMLDTSLTSDGST